MATLLVAITVHAQTFTPEQQRFVQPATLKIDKRDEFFKPSGKFFIISSAAYWSGASADLISSRGLYELNGLQRGRGGRLDYRKGILIDATIYGVTLAFEKRHPKIASFLRFAFGGAHVVAAVHNLRQ
ncbi:MAG: hypothetical protein QOH63_2564 [Acidobacteriota bacterium]|jgi:hypothetical protein|nr:hypothetical protein [Acidobacteriota bacterium]